MNAAPGDVTALVGANGAGKTTLFRVFLGFLSSRRGSVRIDGRSPRAHRRARGVGYLPESLRLPGGWRVGELFREGARLAGMPRAERPRAVYRALERTGFDRAALRAPLAGLSRGMARRVQLAYALVGDPGLILLDEPWSGLDPPSRARLRTTIRRIAGDGATVIVASHELDEIQRTADRAVLLEGGRVARVVTGAAALAPGALERTLLGGGGG